MGRRLIAFNWIAGTLLLVMALFYPEFNERFMIASRRMLAEQMVTSIAQFERRHYATQERYVTFASNEMPEAMRDVLNLKGAAQDDFVYDAFLAEDGQLVVRAQTSPVKIRSGSLPPLTYSLRLSQLDHGTWEPHFRNQ